MDPRIETVLRIVDKQWNQRIEVNDLARRVGLSVPRLQHLVKAETGKSVRAHLIQRRLARAADLLTRSDLRVKEICQRVGFTDCSDFYRSFRKRYGVGPRAFRARQRQF